MIEREGDRERGGERERERNQTKNDNENPALLKPDFHFKVKTDFFPR